MKIEESLKAVKADIAEFCGLRGVSAEELKYNAHKFSREEREFLLYLLKKKLYFQERLFEVKGGSLANLRFLASYR